MLTKISTLEGICMLVAIQIILNPVESSLCNPNNLPSFYATAFADQAMRVKSNQSSEFPFLDEVTINS